MKQKQSGHGLMSDKLITDIERGDKAREDCAEWS